MPGRAPQAYEYYKDLSQRAEYLLVGIIAASVAFFWKAEEPAKVGLNPATLHLAGLLFLFAAMLIAVSRLHKQPTIFARMAENLDLGDERAALVKSASQGQSVVGSYGALNPAEQLERIEKIDRERAVVKSAMDKLNNHCSELYKIRNRVLVSGYLILICDRIWLPTTRFNLTMQATVGRSDSSLYSIKTRPSQFMLAFAGGGGSCSR